MRNVLGYRVAIKPFGPSFASVTAVLYAAEGRFGHRRDEMVDREISDLDIVGQTVGIVCRARKSIGGQAEGQRIGFLDRLIKIAHGIDQRQWAERFLVHGARVIRHIGKNGERKEISAITDPAPASKN